MNIDMICSFSTLKSLHILYWSKRINHINIHRRWFVLFSTLKLLHIFYWSKRINHINIHRRWVVLFRPWNYYIDSILLVPNQLTEFQKYYGGRCEYTFDLNNGVIHVFDSLDFMLGFVIRAQWDKVDFKEYYLMLKSHETNPSCMVVSNY